MDIRFLPSRLKSTDMRDLLVCLDDIDRQSPELASWLGHLVINEKRRRMSLRTDEPIECTLPELDTDTWSVDGLRMGAYSAASAAINVNVPILCELFDELTRSLTRACRQRSAALQRGGPA